MKMFLINLEKDAEKLTFMVRQLKSLGVDFERVAAVDGRLLSRDELSGAVRAARRWCALGRELNPAEVGCALSHYGIYRQLKPGECACILEDDVILDGAFVDRLREIESRVDPERAQVVLLNDHSLRYANRDERGLVRSDDGSCTDGYVITYGAARALLEANWPMIVPCDTWGRWVRQRRIELYHAVPCVVRQDQERFGSTTQPNGGWVKDLPFARWVVHKMKRVVGVVVDRCLQRVTGR